MGMLNYLSFLMSLTSRKLRVVKFINFNVINSKENFLVRNEGEYYLLNTNIFEYYCLILLFLLTHLNFFKATFCNNQPIKKSLIQKSSLFNIIISLRDGGGGRRTIDPYQFTPISNNKPFL